MISLFKEPFFFIALISQHFSCFLSKKENLERTGFVHDYKDCIIKRSKMKFKQFLVKR
jgi:hypothetical protein